MANTKVLFAVEFISPLCLCLAVAFGRVATLLVAVASGAALPVFSLQSLLVEVLCQWPVRALLLCIFFMELLLSPV